MPDASQIEGCRDEKARERYNSTIRLSEIN